VSLLCRLFGHRFPDERREAGFIVDSDAAHFAWNLAGHIARGGRYYFRARCDRCGCDEPFDRTLA
jgi:hypothetical protein